MTVALTFLTVGFNDVRLMYALKFAHLAHERAMGSHLRVVLGLERFDLRPVCFCLLCGLGLAGLAELLFFGSPFVS